MIKKRNIIPTPGKLFKVIFKVICGFIDRIKCSHRKTNLNQENSTKQL